MSPSYIVRPKADDDLEEQANYFAQAANLETAHRFLDAAHRTFELLATQPKMGWLPKLNNPALSSLRIFRVSGFEKILILYLPFVDSVEIVRLAHGSRNLEAFLRRQGIR